MLIVRAKGECGPPALATMWLRPVTAMNAENAQPLASMYKALRVPRVPLPSAGDQESPDAASFRVTTSF